MKRGEKQNFGRSIAGGKKSENNERLGRRGPLKQKKGGPRGERKGMISRKGRRYRNRARLNVFFSLAQVAGRERKPETGCIQGD